MLPNLLDVAMPSPIDLFMMLYEEQPLIAALIPVGFLLVTTITIIAFASKERKEDKRNREKHDDNKQ